MSSRCLYRARDLSRDPLSETDPIPRELLERLVHYATRASNPGNSQLWSFVILQDAAKKQRIADAVATVMKPAMRSRESGSGTEKRMYEGALHLVETFARIPAIVFVCAKNGYPPVNPNIGFVWSAVYPASQNLILAARGLGSRHHVHDVPHGRRTGGARNAGLA